LQFTSATLLIDSEFCLNKTRVLGQLGQRTNYLGYGVFWGEVYSRHAWPHSDVSCDLSTVQWLERVSLPTIMCLHIHKHDLFVFCV